jgi:hypothetical protein
MNYRYISLIFFLLSIINIESYIILPFKELEKDEIYNFKDVDELLSEMSYLKLYSEFYIGSSPHKLFVLFKPEINYLALMENNEDNLESSNNNYYPSTSESFKFQENSKKVIINGKDVLVYASDTFHFIMSEGDITSIYSDKNKGIIDANNYYSFNNINFLIPESKEISNFCGIFGLSPEFSKVTKNFIDELFQKRLIESTVWSVDFPDFEEDTLKKGNIIIGELPHIYNPQYYQENQYFTTKIESSNKGWKIKIDSATILKQYYENTHKKEIGASMPYLQTITIDFGAYMMYAPIKLFEQLKELYFENLFESKICNYKKIRKGNDVIIVIFCDKNTFDNNEQNNFPTIIFDVQDLGGSFELNYKDVFISKNEKIFFMIAFSSTEIDNTIRLGQIFLYKYQFTFDYSYNEIGFYRTDLNSKRVFHRIKRAFRRNIILIIIILIGIFGGLYFCYKKGIIKKKKIDYATANKNISHFTGENIEQGYELKNDN